MLRALWGLHSLGVKHYGQENNKRRLINSTIIKPGSRTRDWHWGEKAAGWWGLWNQKTVLQVIVQRVHRACVAFWLGAGSGLHLHYLISPPEIIVFSLHLPTFGGHLVQLERTKKIWTTGGLSTSPWILSSLPPSFTVCEAASLQKPQHPLAFWIQHVDVLSRAQASIRKVHTDYAL